VQRFVRFMIHKSFYEMRAFNWLFRRMGMIPVADSGPRAIVRTLKRAREELLAGHVVCIFAEGSISRTGNLLPFRRGIEKILDGVDVPVVPVHLDQLWGSIFSFKGGRFFWKRPERLPYPVTVSFGAALPATSTARDVRQAVQELGSEAARHRRGPDDLLHLRFLRAAKRHWRSLCAVDDRGGRVTFGQALARSLVMARRLRALDLPGTTIGVALPPSVEALLVNVALTFAGKVPANLGPAWDPEDFMATVKSSGIRTVITPDSPGAAGARLRDIGVSVIEVGDIDRAAKGFAMWLTGLAAWLAPGWALAAIHRGSAPAPDAAAAVAFSSGSTGARRGVVLSHSGVLSDVEATAQVLWITAEDRIVGVLPYWHPLGLTATLWLPLVSGCAVVYAADGDDAGAVGQTVSRSGGTILISTPRQAEAYREGCHAGDLGSLRYALAGGEPVGATLAEAFREKFGVDLLEGYGCAEMGAVVSVGVANVTHGRERQTGAKPGAAGHPVPGVTVRIVDPETGAALTAGETGRLMLKGPGRMIGYLDDPKATSEAFRDGWFETDDLARIDEDGFLHLAGRLE
jgi:acyl-[acyl-carrier-protein]-phospholipid O-acyltransferase/long-chain-fatty-acid--[acyl-carrier-protein] ligase